MNCDSRSYQKDQLKIDSRAGMSGSAAAACDQCPAGRVFQYQVGSGRVLDKILGSGSGSGSGRSVGKYDRVFPGTFFTFGYFRVSRVCRVFSGISWFTHIY